MSRSTPLFLVALPVAALSAGCTSGGGLLGVDFQRIDVKALSWEDIEADFVFDVDNASPVGFSVARYSYDLDFEGVDFLAGDNPDGLTLNADGSSEIPLPVHVDFTELYDTVQAVRGEDEIGFGLAGDFGIKLARDTIQTSGGSGDPEDTSDAASSAVEQDADGSYVVEVPYHADGGFPALRTPKFSFKKLRVDWANTDTSTAALLLDLNVTNEHASTLDFLNFGYDLEVEGHSVVSGIVDSLGVASGASAAASGEASAEAITDTLTLPLNVDISELAEAGVDFFEGDWSKVDLGLTASMDVDTPFGVVPLDIAESGNVDVDAD